MAPIWKKALEFLGLSEDDDAAPIREVSRPEPIREPRRLPAPRAVAPLYDDEGDDMIRTIASPRATVASIHRAEPRRFNDVRDLADRFKEGKAVIMNLAAVDDPGLVRRLIDFASGVVFGLGGKIETVGTRVYLLTPHNMEVSAEDRDRFIRGDLPPLF